MRQQTASSISTRDVLDAFQRAAGVSVQAWLSNYAAKENRSLEFKIKAGGSQEACTVVYDEWVSSRLE